MIRKVLFILASLLLLPTIGLRADEGKSFSKQMNGLKRSGDYVYAESTAPNEADAKAACDALLKIEVTKYLKSVDPQAGDRIITNIGDYYREYLVQPRGDMTRVFGYISKKSISKPKKESSPKMPKAVEAPKEEAAPAPPDLAVPETTGKEATEPREAADSIPVEKPEIKNEAVQPEARQKSGGLHTEGLQLAKWQIEMLESVVNEPDMMAAKRMLNRFKNQNRIKRLGDKSVANPRPADSFYLVYDSAGKPAALLAPSAGSDHYDMLSGTSTNLEKYRGNQYYWFQISK